MICALLSKGAAQIAKTDKVRSKQIADLTIILFNIIIVIVLSVASKIEIYIRMNLPESSWSCYLFLREWRGLQYGIFIHLSKLTRVWLFVKKHILIERHIFIRVKIVNCLLPDSVHFFCIHFRGISSLCTTKKNCDYLWRHWSSWRPISGGKPNSAFQLRRCQCQVLMLDVLLSVYRWTVVLRTNVSETRLNITQNRWTSLNWTWGLFRYRTYTHLAQDQWAGSGVSRIFSIRHIINWRRFSRVRLIPEGSHEYYDWRIHPGGWF